MKRYAAHALLWGGLATMIGGLYVLAGTGWAAFVGGFMVYAVAYDTVKRERDRKAIEAVQAAIQRQLQGGQTAGETFAAAVRETLKTRHN